MTLTAARVLCVRASIASRTSFGPQAVKIARTRETGDLSPVTYGITVTSFALWVGYGVALGEWPLIVTNSVCGVLALSILVMILRDRRRGGAVSEASRPRSSAASSRTEGTAQRSR